MSVTPFYIDDKLVNCYFNYSISELKAICNSDNIVIVTDDNIFKVHESLINPYRHICLSSGEDHKNQQSVNIILEKLLEWKADKSTFLIGVGGGVVTDITGFAASIYKRGIRLGFLPTSILGMVDAAIGGKNGINLGGNKNMLGTVYQPEFILYDFNFLISLSDADWSNGFAEIIKHACIADAEMFDFLLKHDLDFFKSNPIMLEELVQKNVAIKMGIVKKDQFEKNERKLLNFGHTFGHAIELEKKISHGQAISIGMIMAAHVSKYFELLTDKQVEAIIGLLKRYQLPAQIHFSSESLIEKMTQDKKVNGNAISFVLLEGIGEAILKEIPLDILLKVSNVIAL